MPIRFHASTLLLALALVPGLALAGLVPSSSRAATVTLEPSAPGTPDRRVPAPGHRLRLTGPIEPGDGERIAAVLRPLRERTPRSGDLPLATLELAGKGGDLLEGIRIGTLLREFDVATLVRDGDICLSACALIFLGGTASHGWPAALPSRTLEIGAQLGFHNFTLNALALQNDAREPRGDGVVRAFTLARQGAAATMRYALDMGVDADFFATLIGQPAENWTWIETAGQFLALGITAQGPLPPPGSLAEQAVNLCNHATGWRVGVRPAQARPVAVLAKRPLLSTDGTTTPPPASTAGLTLSGGRMNRSGPAASVAPTSTARFDIAGPASDNFQMVCQVTLSTVDLDTFELALATSGGLLRSYALPPSVNPGLLRYHRDDRLNPRR
jgi:hypothetical protein